MESLSLCLRYVPPEQAKVVASVHASISGSSASSTSSTPEVKPLKSLLGETAPALHLNKGTPNQVSNSAQKTSLLGWASKRLNSIPNSISSAISSLFFLLLSPMRFCHRTTFVLTISAMCCYCSLLPQISVYILSIMDHCDMQQLCLFNSPLSSNVIACPQALCRVSMLPSILLMLMLLKCLMSTHRSGTPTFLSSQLGVLYFFFRFFLVHCHLYL